jgi:hypothetical protein
VFQCASAMAGKQLPSSLARARAASPRGLLAAAALLLLLLLAASYSLLLSPSSPGGLASPSSGPGSAADTAFLASLDRFLASPRRSAAPAAAPGDLDAAIRAEEEERLYGGGAWPAAPAPLRVYVYEMPSRFTYDLLRLFRDSYRETSNLTSNGSPVHRLVEQVRSNCFLHSRGEWSVLGFEFFLFANGDKIEKIDVDCLLFWGEKHCATV